MDLVMMQLQLLSLLIRQNQLISINFKYPMSLNSCIVTDYTNSNILFQYVNSSFKKNINQDSKLIATKAKQLRSKIGERQKLKSDYGNWYITRGANDLLYAACTTQDYPQRTAFGLIKNMENTIDKVPKVNETNKKIKQAHKQLTSLCDKYKEATVDKVKQAQKQAQALRLQLNKGVRNLIGNKENLDQINDKAILMKDYAKSFQKSSENLQKVMCWRKWRFFILIGAVLAIAFIAAGLIIYSRTH